MPEECGKKLECGAYHEGLCPVTGAKGCFKIKKTTWKQQGYAVVSLAVGGLPLVHDFVKTEGEATDAEEKAMELPEELRENLLIVEATLIFDLKR